MSETRYAKTRLCLLLEEAIREEDKTASVYEKLIAAAEEILDTEKREDFVKTMDDYGFRSMGREFILKLYRDEFCWMGDALETMKRELDRKVDVKMLEEKLGREQFLKLLEKWK